MFLLVPAHPGCTGQNPQSRKTVVCVCASHAQLMYSYAWVQNTVLKYTDDVKVLNLLIIASDKVSDVMSFIPVFLQNSRREHFAVWTEGEFLADG